MASAASSSAGPRPAGPRSPPLAALALGLGALLGGCEGASAGIGSPCVDAFDCGSGSRQACVLAWPGGYCTEIDCRLGSCPSGSRCVTGIRFPNVELDAFCLATCETDPDCRDGYRCADIREPEKVCAPK
jgi:hypothetical protein